MAVVTRDSPGPPEQLRSFPWQREFGENLGRCDWRTERWRLTIYLLRRVQFEVPPKHIAISRCTSNGKMSMRLVLPFFIVPRRQTEGFRHRERRDHRGNEL